MSAGERNLPSGLVTFVATDIEGSTKLLLRDREEYAATLSEHHRLLAEVWQQHRGQVVDMIGDGSLAVFAEARDAVRAVEQAQRDLAEHVWAGQAPRVRIGVHSGFATVNDSGYVSIAVHQANRVCQSANGTQVLISADTVTASSSVIEPHNPENPTDAAGLGLRAIGRFRVRDFERPIELFTLAQAPALIPAPRCIPADHHNLRHAGAPLVGRDHELAMLDRLMRDQRVVSLLGSAGVGKSRLAREWGLRHATDFADGVWWSDCSLLGTWNPPTAPAAATLAASSALDTLVTALVATLGLTPHSVGGSAHGVHRLADPLRDRDLVIILDGAEHWRVLIAALVSELLPLCPRVRVLVTSTEPLWIESEAIQRLLPLPSDDAESPAVQLFLQRAQTAQPGLVVDDGYRAASQRLCQRLDGLPLALEIAAARADLLSPQQILQALDDGLGLPQLRDPTRPARHHTLTDLLAWHTALLSAEELLALRRFSFFPNSFDLASAQVAAGFEPLDPQRATQLLWSLLDRSLLICDPDHGAGRYRMLQTVRDVVRAWPGQQPVTGSTGHDDQSSEVAEQAVRLGVRLRDELGPQTPTTRSRVDAMDADVDTMRAVLAALPQEHSELAQELSVAIARRHVAAGSVHSGLVEVRALAGRWSKPTPARVGLLTELGSLYARVGEARSALRMADLADAVREQTGAPAWDDMGVEKIRGEDAIAHDRPQAAVMLARQALAQPISARGRARMCNLLGLGLLIQNDLEGSSRAFEGELAAARESGDDALIAIATNNTAEMLLRSGRVREAAVRQRAALEQATVLGQRALVAFSLLAVARIAAAQHHEPRAEGPSATVVGLLAKAEAMLTEIGMSLFGTDARVAEEFALAARERFGAKEYHRLSVTGRAMDDNHAALRALQVLDGVLAPAGAPRG